jgi:hypothetical protein
LLKHPSLQKKTTDVVIQQHNRRLLMMDILMSETCWAHNKCNKIASDMKLVSHSSTIAMMHGPINIKFLVSFTYMVLLFYCDLSYLNLNIRLYTIATLQSECCLFRYILRLIVLYLTSCMIFITLFLYWQVPYPTGHNP